MNSGTAEPCRGSVEFIEENTQRFPWTSLKSTKKFATHRTNSWKTSQKVENTVIIGNETQLCFRGSSLIEESKIATSSPSLLLHILAPTLFGFCFFASIPTWVEQKKNVTHSKTKGDPFRLGAWKRLYRAWAYAFCEHGRECTHPPSPEVKGWWMRVSPHRVWSFKDLRNLLVVMGNPHPGRLPSHGKYTDPIQKYIIKAYVYIYILPKASLDPPMKGFEPV